MQELRYVKDMEEDCDLCGVDNNGHNLRLIDIKHYHDHLLCVPCAFRVWEGLRND